MKSFYLLLCGLFLFGFQASKAQSKSPSVNGPIVRQIKADLNKVKGPNSKVWRECVGAGRANEGLRADWQEQLRLVKKECGFEYIRMHGLLHDDMGVYFEDKKGNPVYNWQYIDQLYDFLISIDVKPFVELSFMPKALASGDKTVFWWKGNITPPKSYEKWSGLIQALTAHFTERYGKEEVKKWYFEVWNEPNLSSFWSSDQKEYFKLYDCTAKAIKSVCPDYRVGGPATAGNGWIPELIAHCTQDNVALDFISTHTYAVTHGFFDKTGESGTILSRNPQSITADVRQSKYRIEHSAKPNLPLHYTEWSTSYTPTDPVHDTYHSAAFILDKVKGTEHLASSMSYWVFTDVFEENGPRTTPFHGGFGLLNYQAIKKPAFYAYRFLNELGNTELQNQDTASFVCKNGKGNVQVLLWDFTITHPGDSVINQVYYKRDLPSKDKGMAQVELTNLTKGRYALKITKVGYRSNDPYATYLQLGSPAQLTKSQVQTIKEANAGKPYVDKIIEIKGDNRFSYQLPLRENDVYFITLEKK